MAKRKRQRMFSREQRQANRAQLLADPPTQAQLDQRELLAWDPSGRLLRSEIAQAECWLGLHEEPDKEPDEYELMRILERRFLALTGDALTVETAEVYMEDPRNYT